MEYIELRSDTMTRLTKQMRESVLTSPYGDWKYNEDSTIKELEAYAAELFGAEEAAYVVSATFGNQCSLLTAGRPGEELITRDEAHIIGHQNGSPGKIARLMTKTLSMPFGYITPEELKKHFRKKKDSQAPKTGILLLEYPTFQGVIPPLENIHECGKMAIAEGLHVHMDGARLFSALAQSKHDPKEIMKYCHSLTICLSKGLLAPIGSIVLGSKEFMSRFKDNRKLLGGVLRKPGVVAGAALIGLKKMRFELWKDNEIARTLAQRLQDLGWIEIIRKVETNMIYFKIIDPSIEGEKLRDYLHINGVFTWINNGECRFVIHHNIREPEIEKIIGLLTAGIKVQDRSIIKSNEAK